ncbi:MAG: hypothetical protein F6K00_02110 [Leptolyngbya sp. SIOISBB]|nr:hypothetical protein [Leptolyngbya sp. SIOISBB]
MASLEKKSDADPEWDPEKRQEDSVGLAPFEVHQWVYLDAAGLNDPEDYGYGWCLKGKGFTAERCGHHTERVSFMTAWH